MNDTLTFFRQFRERYHTTGSILPSSRFLAKAMTGPLSRRDGAVKMLEIGPGTGAVTKSIVKLLKPEDRFDLVELNESFASHLQEQFENDTDYKRVAEVSKIHVCPLQEFESDCKYDFIISGLPLNNFPSELVAEIFDVYFRLLAPSGVLSYFEYQYIRTIKKMIVGKQDRKRLKETRCDYRQLSRRTSHQTRLGVFKLPTRLGAAFGKSRGTRD